ncbi:hypothetical protein [Nocardioides pakistanensis]
MSTPGRSGPRCAALFVVPTSAVCYAPAGHDGDHEPPRPGTERRVDVDWARHSIPPYALEETCRCGAPAAHNIAETSGPDTFHPLTAYLCCDCFTSVLGPCATYPYDLDTHRSVTA